MNALESVRQRPGKFWKEICRRGRFVRGLCRTPQRLNRESIGLNVDAVSSSLLNKIVTCGKELWRVMKVVVVVNSVKKGNDKAFNGVERILLGRWMSGGKMACQDNTDLFFFSVLTEFFTASLFLKRPQWSVTVIWEWWNFSTHACAMSERSSSETTAAAVTWNVPSHCALDVKEFLPFRSFCVIRYPFTRHVWHRQSVFLPEDETDPKRGAFQRY